MESTSSEDWTFCYELTIVLQSCCYVFFYGLIVRNLFQSLGEQSLGVSMLALA